MGIVIVGVHRYGRLGIGETVNNSVKKRLRVDVRTNIIDRALDRAPAGCGVLKRENFIPDDIGKNERNRYFTVLNDIMQELVTEGVLISVPRHQQTHWTREWIPSTWYTRPEYVKRIRKQHGKEN